MHERLERRSSSSSSFAKALMFLLVLIVAWFVADRVGRKGLPGPFAEMMSAEQAPSGGYILLDTTLQRQFMEAAAGFWRAPLHDSLSVHLLSGTDMVELKENGIVWRVRDYRLFMPDGDTLAYRKVYDAYLRPHGWIRDKDSVAACDVRILRQATIAGGDTCYGPTNVDVVWRVGIEGSGLELNGRPHTAYSGDLSVFFPDGAIDMLENAYRGGGPGGPRSAYEVRDGRITLVKPFGAKDAQVTMDLPACDSGVTFVSFARLALARGIGSADSILESFAAVDSLVDRTYGTLLRWDLRNRPGDDVAGVRKRFEISFGIASDGAVEKLEIAPNVSRRVRAVVSEHARDWRLPQWAGETEQAGRELTIRLR